MTTDLGVLRLIDASLNRLKEGVRVVEDICRYKYNEASLASSLKTIRHSAKLHHLENLLDARESQSDVGRKSQASEMRRSSIESIVTANFRRAQEASRTLEELLKLVEPSTSEIFKNIRYELYALEKETYQSLFKNTTSNSK